MCCVCVYIYIQWRSQDFNLGGARLKVDIKNEINLTNIN